MGEKSEKWEGEPDIRGNGPFGFCNKVEETDGNRETFMSLTMKGNQTGVIWNQRNIEHVFNSGLISRTPFADCQWKSGLKRREWLEGTLWREDAHGCCETSSVIRHFELTDWPFFRYQERSSIKELTFFNVLKKSELLMWLTMRLKRSMPTSFAFFRLLLWTT